MRAVERAVGGEGGGLQRGWGDNGREGRVVGVELAEVVRLGRTPQRTGASRSPVVSMMLLRHEMNARSK